MRRHRYCIVTAALSCLMMAVPVHADYDASVTQQVQQKLNEAGFDCGMPDGVAGAKTEEAIRAFQESRNLTADGVISEELLEALGLLEEEQETENVWEEESMVDDGADDVEEDYLNMTGDLYYTPGEDLVLFHMYGLKIILKGDQSDALVNMAVEVVNDSDMDFDIAFGLYSDYTLKEIEDYLDEDQRAWDDLCVVPAHTTVEGSIWEEGYVPWEGMQRAKLYFTLYDSDRVTLADIDPITIHFQEDGFAAGTESGDNGEATESDMIWLFEGADMAQYTGNWMSLAPSDTGLQDIEICVPEDWSYSATDLDGFTVGKFLSSEAIVEMQEYLSAHPGEAYTAAPEGIAALVTLDPEITGVLNEMAEAAKTTLLSGENGRNVYEMDETQIEEKALTGENGGTDVESNFFYYVNDLRAEKTGSTYWIYDGTEAGGALILADMADSEAEEALQTLRMSGVKKAVEEESDAKGGATFSDFDVPAIPEKVIKAGGGIPDTVEEVKEQVRNTAQFDIDQLSVLYEQCDPSGLLEELRKTGTCTVPVTGEGWSGTFSYGEDYSGDQSVDLEFIQSAEGVMVTYKDAIDTTEYPACEMELHYNMDGNEFTIDSGIYHEERDIPYSSVKFTCDLDVENKEGINFTYGVKYSGLKAGGGMYSTELDLLRDDETWSMHTWQAYYDIDGKLLDVY